MIQYTSIAGSGGLASFTAVAPTLPNRVTGTIDTSTPGQINLINISQDYLHWAGFESNSSTSSSIWDISTTANPPGYNNPSNTQNWRLNSNSSPTTYEQISTPGDTVVFDDLPQSLGGSFTVNLTAALSPTAVTVNAMNNYTFMGTGNLTGTMQLVKTNPARCSSRTVGTITRAIRSFSRARSSWACANGLSQTSNVIFGASGTSGTLDLCGQ